MADPGEVSLDATADAFDATIQCAIPTFGLIARIKLCAQIALMSIRYY